MKKLLLALFGVVVIGLLSALPEGKNYQPRVAFTNSLASAAPTYLISEGWEGDNTSVWSIQNTASAVNLDNTTNILEGSQSLSAYGVDAANYAFNTTLFAATDDIWAFTICKLVAGPTSDDFTRSAFWLVDSANNHLLTCEVYRLAAGQFKWAISGGTSGSTRTVATFPEGFTNAVWVHYIKGSGANGTVEVYFDDYGDGVATKPTLGGNNTASRTDNDSTTSCQRIQLGAGLSGGQGTSMIYDHVRVDDVSIGNSPQ